jgi:hypothetical protein
LGFSAPPFSRKTLQTTGRSPQRSRAQSWFVSVPKKPQAFHSYTPIARCAQRLLREKTRRGVGTTRARGFTLAPRRPPASVCLALAFPRGQPSGTTPKLCCVKRSPPRWAGPHKPPNSGVPEGAPMAWVAPPAR